MIKAIVLMVIGVATMSIAVTLLYNYDLVHGDEPQRIVVVLAFVFGVILSAIPLCWGTARLLGRIL